jgi:hypothetical protein
MRRFFISISTLIILTGCYASQGKYPDDWSAPRAGNFSFLKNDGCPEINGVWDIKGKPHWPIFGLIDGNKKNIYETITITGESSSQLTIELKVSFASILERISDERKMQIEKGYNDNFPQERFLKRMDPKVRTSPPYNTMSDAEYRADLISSYPFYMNQTHSVTAKRGREYICKSGWLIELYSNDMKQTSGSTYSVGLNEDGDLLRKGERVDIQHFSLGWGDYNRDIFRLPDLHKEWWDRRITTTPIVDPKPSWQVPFTPAPKPPPPKIDVFIPLTQEQVNQLIQQHLPKEAVLKKTRSNGNKWELSIQATKSEYVSRFIHSLSQDAKLSQVEMSDAPSTENGNIAKIWIRPAPQR